MKFLDIRTPEDKMKSNHHASFRGVPRIGQVGPRQPERARYVKIKKMISDYRFSPAAPQRGTACARPWNQPHSGLGSRAPSGAGRAREEHSEPGVFLLELTREIAIELYSVREVLEGMAAASPCRDLRKDAREDGALLRAQEKIVAEETWSRTPSPTSSSTPAYTPPAGNAILREMLESIKQKARPIAMHITPILTELFHDHEMIVHACACAIPCSPRSPS